MTNNAEANIGQAEHSEVQKTEATYIKQYLKSLPITKSDDMFYFTRWTEAATTN